MMSIQLRQVHINRFLNRKLKASITVESAISFTLTVFVLFLMLSPLLIIKTTSDMLIDMNNASKNRCYYEMVKYSAKDSNIYNELRKKFDKIHLDDSKLSIIENVVNYIVNMNDFSKRYDDSKSEYRNVRYVYDLSDATYDEDTGIVKYDYDVSFKLAYNLFFVNDVHKRLVSYRRAFIGADENRFGDVSDDGEYIYLANNYVYSSVYHTYIDCTHLVKNTFSFEYKDLSSQRNDNNQKFTKCDYCFRTKNITDDTICYGTHYGDKFHYRSNCPVMTAYVTKVPIDYIEKYDLVLCKACEKRGGE